MQIIVRVYNLAFLFLFFLAPALMQLVKNISEQTLPSIGFFLSCNSSKKFLLLSITVFFRVYFLDETYQISQGIEWKCDCAEVVFPKIT